MVKIKLTSTQKMDTFINSCNIFVSHLSDKATVYLRTMHFVREAVQLRSNARVLHFTRCSVGGNIYQVWLTNSPSLVKFLLDSMYHLHCKMPSLGVPPTTFRPLTFTFNPRRVMVMTSTHAEGQRSHGSKVEWKRMG